ncbi:MAG: hypothetical protein JWL94_2152 [Microbacteriaceae bacterium]|jgi:O-succinylbenzoate synthase|nr:hypothetical protein [Microbacteriaceae bacterium]
MATLPRVTVLAAALLMLSGCVATEPGPVATPEATSEPVFASEEEALAAATKAYAAYQEVLDAAFATHDVSSLATVAIDPALTAVRESVADYVVKGHHQIGLSSIDGVSFVDASPLTGRFVEGEVVQIYGCLDVSGVDVVNASGSSVVALSRASRYPLVASLAWSVGEQRLLVTEEETWDGANFCI